MFPLIPAMSDLFKAVTPKKPLPANQTTPLVVPSQLLGVRPTGDLSAVLLQAARGPAPTQNPAGSKPKQQDSLSLAKRPTLKDWAFLGL